MYYLFRTKGMFSQEYDFEENQKCIILEYEVEHKVNTRLKKMRSF